MTPLLSKPGHRAGPGHQPDGAVVELFGLELDALTLPAAVERVIGYARTGEAHLVFTPNVDHVVQLRRDGDLSRAYSKATLRLADGAPIVLVSRLTGDPLPARVAGADLLPSLCRRAAELGLRVFVLGGAPDALLNGMARLAETYPGLMIDGYSPEFGFERDPERAAEVARRVRTARADIVFCCLGAPKSEKWTATMLPQLGSGVILSVGAAIDFAAGGKRRAPVLVQRLGMEWLFRLLQEPGRLWRRYLVEDREFLWLAAREVLGARRERGSARVLPFSGVPTHRPAGAGAPETNPERIDRCA